MNEKRMKLQVSPQISLLTEDLRNHHKSDMKLLDLAQSNLIN